MLMSVLKKAFDTIKCFFLSNQSINLLALGKSIIQSFNLSALPVGR